VIFHIFPDLLLVFLAADDPSYRRRHIERRWQHGSTASATPECTLDYLCFQMCVSHREEEENHGNKFSGRNITMDLSLFPLPVLVISP
jgi:hypothetical protein